MTAATNPYAVVNIESIHLDRPDLMPKAEFYNNCKSMVGKQRWWNISITFVIDKGNNEEVHDTFSWSTQSKVFLGQTLTFAIDEIKKRIATGKLLRARMVFVIKEKALNERKKPPQRRDRRIHPAMKLSTEEQIKYLMSRGDDDDR